MPQEALPWKASANFFLRRISSRSGEERSGRKGTKTGLRPDELDLAGDARLGCGACKGVVVRMMGPGLGCAFDAGTACGNCEGAAGLGRRPELFVKGWVARGSKEESVEFGMVVVGGWGGLRWLGRGGGRCNGECELSLERREEQRMRVLGGGEYER